MNPGRPIPKKKIVDDPTSIDDQANSPDPVDHSGNIDAGNPPPEARDVDGGTTTSGDGGQHRHPPTPTAPHVKL